MQKRANLIALKNNDFGTDDSFNSYAELISVFSTIQRIMPINFAFVENTLKFLNPRT
jgi:hypothetical protein